MIPLSDQSWQSQSWQQCLSTANISLEDLVKYLQLDGGPKDQWLANREFPLFAPRPYISRIERGNPADPLLLQILPQARELEIIKGFTRDPLDEFSVSPQPGLLHKYAGRALIITTGSCAINCRYCFRRHYPYETSQPDTQAWQKLFGYLSDDTSIKEIILSGGDPLVLKDSRLAWIASELSSINHIKRLRIHTRLPVVIPQRVTPELLDWMSSSSLQLVMVLHSNHPNELDEQVAFSVAKMLNAGISVLNQSVMLAGVNDRFEVLAALSERLFDIGVLPYYLHLLDKVAGAGHFNVADEKALSLYRQLCNNLPGYLVPKMVREEQGKPSKTLIMPH